MTSVSVGLSRMQADIAQVRIDPMKVIIFLLAMIPFALCWTSAVVVKVVLAAGREGWRVGTAALTAQRSTGGG